MSASIPEVPTPLSPVGGDVVDGSYVEFLWTGVAGATDYWLQVASDSRFEDLWFDASVGDTTSLTLYDHLPERGEPVYWRIRSRSSKGWQPWCEALQVTALGDQEVSVADQTQDGGDATRQPERSPYAPRVIAPSLGALVEGSYVSLLWHPVAGATAYWIQIAAEASFKDLRFNNVLGDTTSLTLIDYLPEQGKSFYWRVRSGSGEEWRPWSDVFSFVAVTDDEAQAYRSEEAESAERDRIKKYEVDFAGIDTNIPYNVETTSVGQLSLVIAIAVITVITLFVIVLLFGSQAGQDVASISAIPLFGFSRLSRLMLPKAGE